MRFLVAAMGIGFSLLQPCAVRGNTLRSTTTAQFAQRLVEAINQRNPESRWQLVHTASRSCVTSETRTYFQEMFARQSRDSIPSNYRLSVETVPIDAPLRFEGELDYPTRPTHSMQIDYDTGPNRSRVLFIYLASEQNVCSEVLACPRPETLAKMKAAEQESIVREQRALRLVAEIPESLRADLARLLQQGRKIEAIKTYASVTQEDLTTSRRVVELVGSALR